jgi:hypothetical protein
MAPPIQTQHKVHRFGRDRSHPLNQKILLRFRSQIRAFGQQPKALVETESLGGLWVRAFPEKARWWLRVPKGVFTKHQP